MTNGAAAEYRSLALLWSLATSGAPVAKISDWPSGLNATGDGPWKEGSMPSVPSGAALTRDVVCVARSRRKMLSVFGDLGATVTGAAETVGGLFVRSSARALNAIFVPSGLNA